MYGKGIFEIGGKQGTTLIQYIEKIKEIKNTFEFELWLCFLFVCHRKIICEVLNQNKKCITCFSLKANQELILWINWINTSFYIFSIGKIKVYQ